MSEAAPYLCLVSREEASRPAQDTHSCKQWRFRTVAANEATCQAAHTVSWSESSMRRRRFAAPPGCDAALFPHGSQEFLVLLLRRTHGRACCGNVDLPDGRERHTFAADFGSCAMYRNVPSFLQVRTSRPAASPTQAKEGSYSWETSCQNHSRVREELQQSLVVSFRPLSVVSREMSDLDREKL